jgi:hypothetical protein
MHRPKDRVDGLIVQEAESRSQRKPNNIRSSNSLGVFLGFFIRYTKNTTTITIPMVIPALTRRRTGSRGTFDSSSISPIRILMISMAPCQIAIILADLSG